MKLMKGSDPADVLRNTAFHRGWYHVASVADSHAGPSALAGKVWGALAIGSLAGIAIGLLTEYYTGMFGPVKRLAETTKTGAATLIISGFALALESVAPPVVVIAFATYYANSLAGLYGIGLAAVGMLGHGRYQPCR